MNSAQEKSCENLCSIFHMRNNYGNQCLYIYHRALTQTASHDPVKNLIYCTLSQCKLGELGRLAWPPSHPDDPNHCLTTCGPSSWAANKPYFTPAPHQLNHFYLWFHTILKKVISAEFTVTANPTVWQKLKNPSFPRTYFGEAMECSIVTTSGKSFTRFSDRVHTRSVMDVHPPPLCSISTHPTPSGS